MDRCCREYGVGRRSLADLRSAPFVVSEASEKKETTIFKVEQLCTSDRPVIGKRWLTHLKKRLKRENGVTGKYKEVESAGLTDYGQVEGELVRLW